MWIGGLWRSFYRKEPTPGPACIDASDAGRSPFQSEMTKAIRLCWDLRRWEKSFPVRKDKSHYAVLGPPTPGEVLSSQKEKKPLCCVGTSDARRSPFQSQGSHSHGKSWKILEKKTFMENEGNKLSHGN